MDFAKELRMKNTSHWAADLEEGDICIATIRHKTDGSLNLINEQVVVVENSPKNKRITGAYQDFEYHIPYNELKPITERLKERKLIKYSRFALNNRWKRSRISRTDQWVIVGIQEYWASPNDFCYKLCFFGLDFCFWFRRDFV